MIVIKVELWPHGFETGKQELAKMYIANDGTGTPTRGNYNGETVRKGSDKGNVAGYVPVRQGRVENYPRASKHVWNLIAKMLKAMGYA